MNDEPEQPVEAASSEPEPRPSIISITAKGEPKDVLDGLLRDLNVLILTLIAAIYYFDCFSLLFLLRFLGQNQSATAGIRIVAVSNLICILTHLLHSITQPAPREVWNHGGALVDFVGEKPASRFKLIVYDFLIASLQILYLALYYRKGTVDRSDPAIASTAVQDLDAEESGISRANFPMGTEIEEGIEMQSLLPDGSYELGNTSHQTASRNNNIILRKRDFKGVFLNTARNAQSEESAAAVRRFWDRVSRVRARRAAQQARAAEDTAS